MARRSCDGAGLLEAFRAAVANLESSVDEINGLNVFPVPDGDTGSNMFATVRAALTEADGAGPGAGADRIAAAASFGALMGARGNSGVILSQIVRGAAEELASRPGELVDPVLVAAAFASAADAAYESVRDPAEGTMLTVIREMAHAASQHLAHTDRQIESTIATARDSLKGMRWGPQA